MSDVPSSTAADSITLAAGTSIVSESTLRATPYARSSQFGGNSGSPFADDLTEVCRLVQVTVYSGLYLEAIECVWERPNGEPLTGRRHGGKGGNPSTFRLEKGDYINRIELNSSGEGVHSLTFYTYKGHKHGPYGVGGGSPHEIAGGPFNGFFGRCGAGIDAFGAFSPAKCP